LCILFQAIFTKILTQVANAINYTSSGSVTVSAECVSCVKNASESTDPEVMRVEFAVRDTGAGIAKGDQGNLWLPYVRGGTAPTLNSY
jgi:signal transduction histidine kinase